MIREIRDADIETVKNINNWYIRNSTINFGTEEYTPEGYVQYVQRVTAEYPWLVLEEKGKVLGFAHLDAWNPKAAYNWTSDLSIYLDQSAVHQGYGHQLMDAILKLAEEDGYRHIISIVTDTNATSLAFHEKYGFTRKWHLEHAGVKYGDWLGVWFMDKEFPNDTKAEPKNLHFADIVEDRR